MEQSIASARATVLIYDDQNKRWVPAGPSQTQGVSKVHIYQTATGTAFRVVGRKLQDHEVVLNCQIQKNLRYNLATATFHQWRDQKLVYGLNFISKEDADAFAVAMQRAIEQLVAAHKAKQAQAAAAAAAVAQLVNDQMRNNQSQNSEEVRSSGPSAAPQPSESVQASQTSRPDVVSHQNGANNNANCAAESINTDAKLNNGQDEAQHSPADEEAAKNGNSTLNQTVSDVAQASCDGSSSPCNSTAQTNGITQQLSNTTTAQLPPTPPPPPPPPPAPAPAPASGDRKAGNLEAHPDQAAQHDSSENNADAFAMALRNVKLKKAGDSVVSRPKAGQDGNEVAGNNSAENPKKLSSQVSDQAPPGVAPRGSLSAGSSDVFNEMQRVFAARKARIEAASEVQPQSESSTSGAAINGESHLQTTAGVASSNATVSINGGSQAKVPSNANAPDAAVTLKELQDLKEELITEMRLEIRTLKSDIAEMIRQIAPNNRS